MTPPLPLVAEGVSVSFGGLRALDAVGLEVHPGEIVGLVGGNGAGKTTFMDCVSGYISPDDGELTSLGVDLGPLNPADRAYLGIGRSYQDARLFGGLTVTETLLVVCERRAPSGVVASMLRLGSSRAAERRKAETVGELVETMGLGPYADKRISELSTGTRRVVDVASILAQEPALLLLDEPTSGLAQRETEAFGPLLRRVQARVGCAVLLIEHDMALVAAVSDRVYALETGKVIAEGTPGEVLEDPAVVASYLGSDPAAIQRSGTLGSRRRPSARKKPAKARARPARKKPAKARARPARKKPAKARARR